MHNAGELPDSQTPGLPECNASMQSGRSRFDFRGQRGYASGSLIEIFLIFSILALLAEITVPNLLRARAQGSLTQCKSNLKNLGTALEMYSADNYGIYPCSLGGVTPNYIKVLPTCRFTGENSYVYRRREKPNIYTTYCRSYKRTRNRFCHNEGCCEHGLDNYPQYDSIQGLIEP